MYQSIHYDRNNRIVHLRDDEEGWVAFDYRPTFYKLDPRGKFTTLDGQKCSPTFKYDPSHFEIDIDMNTRVLIDLYKETDSVPKYQNILFLDIEIKIGGQLTKEYVWSAPMPVTSIAMYDDTMQKYYVFILDENNKLQDIIKDDRCVYRFSSERDLLSKFVDVWAECDPTIVAGWNSDFFDMPYLIRRIKNQLGDRKVMQLSPRNIVLERPDDEYKPIQIVGVASFDLLRLHKKYIQKQEDSYSLDFIGQKYGGLGKLKFNGNLDRLFEEDIQKYIEYNINDVEILIRINKKLQFIKLSIMICHLGHIGYDDVYQSSKINEGAILTYLKRLDVVSPNKPTTINPLLKETIFEKTAGGFLKPPIPGLYPWIFDLDLTTMYPSIMRTLNMGGDTLIGRIVLQNQRDCWWSYREIKALPEDEKLILENKNGQITDITAKDLVKFIDDNKVYVSANGALYNGSKKSIIYDVLTDWFDKRVEYKKLMNKAKKEKNTNDELLYKIYQLAIKVLLNSIYGCMALNSFRYGDGKKIIAGSVTLTGQRIIQESIKTINELMSKEIGEGDQDYVIASDTDSMFIQSVPVLKKRDPNIDIKNDIHMVELVQSLAREYQGIINKYYKKLAVECFNNNEFHYFEIKMETIIKAGYWSKKRRYAQYIVNEEGIPVDKLDFKGLELMKSNFPAKFKEFGKQTIKKIILGASNEEVNSDILSFKDNLKVFEVKEISKPTGVEGLGKWVSTKSSKGDIFSTFRLGAPAHVKAAVRYNDLIKHLGLSSEYEGIKNFDKIFWCNLNPNPYKIESIAFTGYNDPAEIIGFIKEYVSREELFNSTFLDKLKTLYKDLGWEFVQFNKYALKFFIN